MNKGVHHFCFRRNLCFDSTVNSNYGKKHGFMCWMPVAVANPRPHSRTDNPTTHYSDLTTRPWPTHQKRIGTSRIVSHTRHINEPITGQEIFSTRLFTPGTGVYGVRDLFPWEIVTKMVISCLLNVEKIWNTNKLKLDLKLLPKICFRRNNIHWEIDQWKRRRFGAKWHVTVPNSVAPVKPIVCKLIYISHGLCCQMTHKLHVR